MQYQMLAIIMALAFFNGCSLLSRRKPVVNESAVPVVSPEAASKHLSGISDVPKHYKVYIWQENGDCLWRIAEKVYGDRSKWPLIYAANRDILHDPNKIYPNQKLIIPPPDWQPN
jgi:nucleoid-associated protein YgaU